MTQEISRLREQFNDTLYMKRVKYVSGLTDVSQRPVHGYLNKRKYSYSMKWLKGQLQLKVVENVKNLPKESQIDQDQISEQIVLLFILME